MSVRLISSKEYSAGQISDFLNKAAPYETFIIDHLLANDLSCLENFLKQSRRRFVNMPKGEFMVEKGVVYLIAIDRLFYYDGVRLLVSLKDTRLYDGDPVHLQEQLAMEKYFMGDARELICTHEPDGVYKYVSPSSFTILGYRPEELIGRDPYSFLHPDDRRAVREDAHLPSLHDGQKNNIQYRIRRKDGTYIWLDTYSYFLRNEQNEVVSIITGSRDITDQKEVEIQLRNSEQRFRGIADNIPGVIYLCHNDPVFSMIYLNREVENLTGYDCNEFLTNTLSFVDLYHPDDREAVFEAVDKALASRQSFHLNYRLRRKDGVWIWIDEYGQGIFENGELKLIEGVLLDITERKQAEALLKEREANLKAIFESTDSMIGLFDRDKRLIEFNQSFAKYVKMTDDVELYQGIALIDHLNQEFSEIFRSYQDRVLQGESFSATIEYPSPTGVLYLLIMHNPIYQNGEVTGISIFVENITELKESQKELERYAEKLETLVAERTVELEKKNRALIQGNEELGRTLHDLRATQAKLIHAEKMASLGMLSAGVAHEINNPLNFIKNGCSALMQELEEHPEFDQNLLEPYLSIINDGVKRAGDIVRSLGRFSRQVDTVNERCVIPHIVDNCLVILNARLKDRISVIRNYDDPPIVISGNEGKLHQAILNILSNAEQAIGEQGTITVAIQRQDEKVQIEISDDGSGISPENLKRLGDPFFTTKSPGAGTGLGLFITFSIIKELRGEIKVKSELKRGTKVTILFSNS